MGHGVCRTPTDFSQSSVSRPSQQALRHRKSCRSKICGRPDSRSEGCRVSQRRNENPKHHYSRRCEERKSRKPVRGWPASAGATHLRVIFIYVLMWAAQGFANSPSKGLATCQVLENGVRQGNGTSDKSISSIIAQTAARITFRAAWSDRSVQAALQPGVDRHSSSEKRQYFASQKLTTAASPSSLGQSAKVSWPSAPLWAPLCQQGTASRMRRPDEIGRSFCCLRQPVAANLLLPRLLLCRPLRILQSCKAA